MAGGPNACCESPGAPCRHAWLDAGGYGPSLANQADRRQLPRARLHLSVPRGFDCRSLQRPHCPVVDCHRSGLQGGSAITIDDRRANAPSIYSLANDNPREWGDLVCFAVLAVTAIKVIRELVRPRASKFETRSP